MAASVRQRLLNRSREEGDNFQTLLTRYASERFLYRLSQSQYRDRFVLKGAMLFVLWEGHLHRLTGDLDLLGYGEQDVESLVEVVREICSTSVPDDGLTFLSETVAGNLIREDQAYEGVRIVVRALLSKARIRLQIDIGFGDAVTPEAEEEEFPTILDSPAPTLRMYPKETVVAEKLENMVDLGIANSRMKDFYDVLYLARRFEFDGSVLTEAIKATFERRRTPLPDEPPLALTGRFSSDGTKVGQWRAFLSRVGITGEKDLPDAIDELRIFLLPLLSALASQTEFNQIWNAGGWRA